MKKNFTVKDLVTLAMITVLYIILSFAIPMYSFGIIQFRIAEFLNFLVIYQKKYALGVVLGVLITNIFSPYWSDLLFGTSHTMIAFFVCLLLFRLVKKHLAKYVIVTLTFSALMFIVGVGICLSENSFATLFPMYISLMLSEGVVLTIGAFVMYQIEVQLKRRALFL